MAAVNWKQQAVEVRDALRRNNVTLLAAGVAFFALLAIVPALAAAVAIWGLFAEPQDVAHVVENLASALPKTARQTIDEQLRAAVAAPRAGLGITAVVGVLIALWSASSATKFVLQAVRTVYGVPRASYVRMRGLGLVITLGVIAFFLAVLALIAVLPASLARTQLGAGLRFAAAWLRWPLLALAMMGFLTLVYRVAPPAAGRQQRSTRPGAVIATLLWLCGSAVFAWYAASFGNFNRTYGSMAGIVVLMFWLFLTAYTVVLGAVINAQITRHPTNSPGG